MADIGKKYYLAVDFGASGGRHILAWKDGANVRMEEIYRFSNSPVRRDGMLCWDLEYLTQQLLNGMVKCREAGKVPVSMGIDTWGLDFVLLDREQNVLGNAVNHRDPFTKGIYEEIFPLISEKELYNITGIQMAEFNTVCQLAAIMKNKPQLLEWTDTMLMMPDYFGFLLTGNKAQEYTNASVTQLLDPVHKNWDLELIDRLGFPRRIFLPVKMPGQRLGPLNCSIAEKVGFNCDVILPATHDTASAFMVVPDGEAVISSGTWSLMGTVANHPILSEKARMKRFTNEGGYEGKNLLLKNSMGLWMIQNIKKEMAAELSYEELCSMAEKAEIDSIVDCSSGEFLAPESMAEAVKTYCGRTGQQIPETAGELAAIIYRSLACSYARILLELEDVTGKKYQSIRMLGGGSNAAYLNQLTADEAGVPVLAGPSEATATGNVMVQMIADGIFYSLEEAQKCFAESFPARKYLPREEKRKWRGIGNESIG